MWNSESLLKMIGIGLVLFGVAFLFKYSIDQGWLTEWVRLASGLAIGIVLLSIGTRVRARRRHFSQVLLGGGIGVLYITGFAAFQLYALVSHPVAFAFMVGVTSLAFFLALRQGEAILSIIGAAGGFGTPFLLYTGAGSLPHLIAYTCLIIGGTSATYMYRGWRSLLWTSVVGGWVVFLIAHDQGSIASQSDRWALQAGILFAWLAFWALPAMREVLGTKNPDRWSLPSLDFISEDMRKYTNRHVHLLSISTPLLALAFSQPIWSLSNETWGWIAMGGAFVYGSAAYGLRRWNPGLSLAYTQALVGLLLLTLAFCLLLKGDALLLTLAAKATVLHLVSKRLGDRGTEISAHLLFAAVAVWLAARLIKGITMPAAEQALFDARSLTHFAAIAAAAGISAALRWREAQVAYRLAAHLAFLAWILCGLALVEGGQGYVTIAWGIYAVALLVLGLRRNLSQLRTVAMGTLLLVVGKLFLVDLAKLETIWRILLFLGFGGVFLVLSYYFQDLWKPAEEPVDQASSDDDSARL